MSETALSHTPLGNTFCLRSEAVLPHPPPNHAHFAYLVSSRNAPHVSTLPSDLTIFTVKIAVFSFQELQIKKSLSLSWVEEATSFFACGFVYEIQKAPLTSFTAVLKASTIIEPLLSQGLLRFFSLPSLLLFQLIFHNATSRLPQVKIRSHISQI